MRVLKAEIPSVAAFVSAASLVKSWGSAPTKSCVTGSESRTLVTNEVYLRPDGNELSSFILGVERPSLSRKAAQGANRK